MLDEIFDPARSLERSLCCSTSDGGTRTQPPAGQKILTPLYDVPPSSSRGHIDLSTDYERRTTMFDEIFALAEELECSLCCSCSCGGNQQDQSSNE